MKNLSLFLVTVGLIVSNLLCNELIADGLHSALKKTSNAVFVESGGIASGQAVSWAWNVGYKKIYMIDSNPVLVNHAKYLFSCYFDLYPCYRPIPFSNWKPELHYLVGDSSQELRGIIKDVHSPITFFLHSFIPNPDDASSTNNILAELKQIQEHPIKTHTILIDNIDLAGTALFGNISLETIISQLRMINNDYVFTFTDGGHLGRKPNGLLIASP